LVLSEQEVIDIKLRLRRGETGVAIARDFGIDPSTVSAIRKEKSFRDVVIIPEERSANGLHRPKRGRKVGVVPDADGFARQALRHLASPDDVRRLIALLSQSLAALDESPDVSIRESEG